MFYESFFVLLFMEVNDVTRKVIGIFFDVYNSLGYGFSEKVYERAMMIEFGKAGLKYENQYPIKVRYAGRVVGDYFADFIVEGIVVELKAIRDISSADECQLLNYLKVCDKKIGLLVNFGQDPKFKRMIL
jgi:GxxExxY protein